jgi:hypothetical protein
MSTLSARSSAHPWVTGSILIAVLAAGGTVHAQSILPSCGVGDPRAARLAESLRNAEANVEKMDRVIAVLREGIEMQNGFEAEGLKYANYAKIAAGAKSTKAVTDSILTLNPAGRRIKKTTDMFDPFIEGGYAMYDGQHGNAAAKGAKAVSNGAKWLGNKDLQGSAALSADVITGANALGKGDLGTWCQNQLSATGKMMGRQMRQEKLMLGGLAKTCKAVLPSPNTTLGTQVGDGMAATSDLMKAAAYAQRQRGAAGLAQHVGYGGRLIGQGGEIMKNEEKFFEGLHNMLDMDDMKLEIQMRGTGYRTQMLSRIKVKTAERDKWAGEAARLRAELARLPGCSEQEPRTVLAGGGRGQNSMNPFDGGMNPFAGGMPSGYTDEQLIAMIDNALREGSKAMNDPSMDAGFRNALSGSLDWLRNARQEIVAGSGRQQIVAGSGPSHGTGTGTEYWTPASAPSNLPYHSDVGRSSGGGSVTRTAPPVLGAASSGGGSTGRSCPNGRPCAGIAN